MLGSLSGEAGSGSDVVGSDSAQAESTSGTVNSLSAEGENDWGRSAFARPERSPTYRSAYAPGIPRLRAG